MNRFPRRIKIDTVKSLLARTGNRCAFPGCEHPLFNANNLFVAQLCHIEAVSPEGPRFNPNRTIEEINSYSNLLFLCYRHHKETDNVDSFSPEKMRQLKDEHEKQFEESKFRINEKALKTVVDEINTFWYEIDRINRHEHVAPEFQVEIDVDSNERSLLNEIRERLRHFEYLVAILSQDLKKEYFEILCLGIPNTMTSITTRIDQLEIKILEQKLMNEPTQTDLRNELNTLKANFKDTAKRAGYAD